MKFLFVIPSTDCPMMQNIYAETTFVCPSYWMAGAYNDYGRTAYKYQYSVAPATHALDVAACMCKSTARFMSIADSSLRQILVQLLQMSARIWRWPSSRSGVTSLQRTTPALPMKSPMVPPRTPHLLTMRRTGLRSRPTSHYS